jgi:hypothetical protein
MTSFYPIVFNEAGQTAVKDHNLPPYIDGSCRREPDLEQDCPAITGLCRPGFAAKLKVGDIVIYCTNKRGIGSRKVVAVLEVTHTESDHESAAKWYKDNGSSLPNNIMVEGNVPFPLEKTHNIKGWDNWADNTNLEGWDEQYKERAKDKPKVAICKTLYKDLQNPIVISNQEMEDMFNRVPGTQNPSIIITSQWEDLKKHLGIN